MSAAARALCRLGLALAALAGASAQAADAKEVPSAPSAKVKFKYQPRSGDQAACHQACAMRIGDCVRTCNAPKSTRGQQDPKKMAALEACAASCSQAQRPCFAECDKTP